MYMLFRAFNFLALTHIYLAAPETKGKMLQEMDEVFDKKRKAWHGPRARARTTPRRA